MDKELLKLVLPEGILEYFTITKVEGGLEAITIYLEEFNRPPEEFKKDKLTSKGFQEPVTIKDFPIRGKACYLKVRRRRWLNETQSKIVARDWQLVAKGTRLTGEFATFLKGVIGQ